MKNTKTTGCVEVKGMNTNNIKFLKGRAKRKLFTQKIMLTLMCVSRTKENSEREQAYWNTSTAKTGLSVRVT